MTKKMKVIGMATAAVLVISSMSVFAADTEYSYLAGRAKGSQYASTDERADVESYGFRKGGNLETRLENGEITQEEYDAIESDKGNRDAKLKEKLATGEITQEEVDAIKAEIEARHEGKGKSGFRKDTVKSESNIGTDTEV
ncbi:MAG: SHOCT domain-containing protein [Clostridia bacterium]